MRICSKIKILIGRVDTYRQVLHLFIKTITVCRKLKTKYIATNNMGAFHTITIGSGLNITVGHRSFFEHAP